METDVEEILAQFRQKDRDWNEGKVSNDAKDLLLILCELDNPQNFSAYWVYEIPTGRVFAWDDEKDQEKAVRALLERNVPVVPRVPKSK